MHQKCNPFKSIHTKLELGSFSLMRWTVGGNNYSTKNWLVASIYAYASFASKIYHSR